ncbi:MAG TPA: three-Cys-motif partner protein TcmP [Elusimicrobiota bacterium]|nr:three-Cys-motif partner protein TcmP [Elusimicrobiota bacterium]
MTQKLRFDEINYWSELKHEILNDYAAAYSKIFASNKQARFEHVYIDAFAGGGIHLSKSSGDFVPGSPLNALQVEPAFKEFYFIDMDGKKLAQLRQIVGDRPDVHFYEGDSNEILIKKVFPDVQYDQYRRALCLLDPYGLSLDWKVIERAGHLGTIDLFLNFPIMDMNRNAIWRNPEKVDPQDVARMTAFWGDESWRQIAYRQIDTLFGKEDEKAPNEVIAEAFRERLQKVAKFPVVPEPLAMKNSKGADVYYLFFASQKKTAETIAKAIFKKYRGKGFV